MILLLSKADVSLEGQSSPDLKANTKTATGSPNQEGDEDAFLAESFAKYGSIFPSQPSEGNYPMTPWFWTSSPQNYEAIKLCCLSCPICQFCVTLLQQPQETKTLPYVQCLGNHYTHTHTYTLLGYCVLFSIYRFLIAILKSISAYSHICINSQSISIDSVFSLSLIIKPCSFTSLLHF